mmetsp:Transcript_7246/g.5765  ORF Transcript_7246/g.5765 Transcript_7246/m.5765 type:complete len:86 (+) Transcript_7246:123-380(+)
MPPKGKAKADAKAKPEAKAKEKKVREEKDPFAEKIAALEKVEQPDADDNKARQEKVTQEIEKLQAKQRAMTEKKKKKKKNCHAVT